MLVLDSNLENGVMGLHPRGVWYGEASTFDVRKQAILIRHECVHFAALKFGEARQAYNEYLRRPNDRTMKDAWKDKDNIYCVAAFRVLWVLAHEAGGHLAVTFLGNGRGMTPEHMRSTNSRLDDNAAGGESGEIFEQSAFGGTVDFYRDNEYPQLEVRTFLDFMT
ncbi:hypothetical protein LTR62_001270 [Meristemomyces frigidus]|uniref:Uncharacterized protein n=1 Tax=Meristemomyces frigidus TaxID=1508187 RepID=A0AAN7T984_9PEZI|nr:hypothetical protein LTR62_001270 [Meristemomyces frigidus]